MLLSNFMAGRTQEEMLDTVKEFDIEDLVQYVLDYYFDGNKKYINSMKHRAKRCAAYAPAGIVEAYYIVRLAKYTNNRRKFILYRIWKIFCRSLENDGMNIFLPSNSEHPGGFPKFEKDYGLAS